MIPNSFFVIAHNIRSLYNVGSIFRTSEALGVDKIYLTGYTGTPKNPKLAKTALGAEKLVPWECCRQLTRLVNRLRREKVAIVGLENRVTGAVLLNKFQPRFPMALLLGEEVAGIKKSYLKLCDAIVEIPQVGKKESLNVAVAFGIAVWGIKNSKFQ